MPRALTQTEIDQMAAARALREAHAVECEGCGYFHPKRIPSRLMPGAKCAVCGHRDPRAPLTPQQIGETVRAQGVLE